MAIEEALEIVFPRSQINEERQVVDEAAQEEILRRWGKEIPLGEITWYVARRDGKIQGYATVLQEIGKHLPIDFFVVLDGMGEVKQVIVLEFRESRGYEVKRRRFLRQFEGRSLMNPIRVGEDIVNISGATLSCEAATIAVRRALLLWQATERQKAKGKR